MGYFIKQGGFVIRLRYVRLLKSFFRRAWLSWLGMKIGKGTTLPQIHISWPHQVTLGANCKLEDSIRFKYDGMFKDGPSIFIGNNVFIGSGCEFNITKRIKVGNDALIASGCKFVDHDHGMLEGLLMRSQASVEEEINLGDGVWLGCNVIVLKGVRIGSGAVVAAGAVVTKSIGDNEIWGGVPARRLGKRV